MTMKKAPKAKTETPKLKGSKAKEFPRIAEALSKPLGEKATEAKPESDGKAATPKAEKKAKPKKEKKAKKVSALDAAARVLEENGEPMGCKDLIETMGNKGYWSSPKGQTPHATLYAAILREVKVKGKDARFTKTDKGKFAVKAR